MRLENMRWMLALVFVGMLLIAGCPSEEPECTSDSDCESGFVCENEECVVEPEPEAPWITTELAIIIAVVAVAIIAIVAYLVLRRRK